jgi:hypothetical protein
MPPITTAIRSSGAGREISESTNTVGPTKTCFFVTVLCAPPTRTALDVESNDSRRKTIGALGRCYRRVVRVRPPPSRGAAKPAATKSASRWTLALRGSRE